MFICVPRLTFGAEADDEGSESAAQPIPEAAVAAAQLASSTPQNSPAVTKRKQLSEGKRAETVPERARLPIPKVKAPHHIAPMRKSGAGMPSVLRPGALAGAGGAAPWDPFGKPILGSPGKK
jgi:hypothetical protein